MSPLERFLQASADALLVVDGTGRVEACNEEAARLFRGTEGDLVGRRVEELMPERCREAHGRHRAGFSSPSRRPMGRGLDTPGLRLDGSEFAAEISLAPWDGDRVLATVVDVSEARRASEALRKFSRVIEQTSSAVMITDRDGVLEYVNPGFVAATGYRAEEVLGRRPSLLKSGHTTAAEYATLWQTIARGDVWHGEFRNRRKDGTLFWQGGLISPIRDERGTVTHFAAVLDDIGARKATETALQVRDEQMSLFIEHAPVALAMFDREMRYLAASRRWIDDYGLEGQPLLGRSHYEVFPEIGERWRAVHRRCLAGGSERAEEDRFERADGSVQWLRWEVLPWHAGGEVGGIVIFGEDISERKRAQLAVERSEERFRATFEQAAVGLAHVAPEGRWLRVNRKLCEIVGYSREELLASAFQGITHPDDLDADLEQMRRLLAGEIEHYAMEKRYLRRDGEAVWIRLTVSLRRTADGTPDYFISVVEDIDERRRSEDALKRLRGEMEQMLALQVAAQTTAAIAHELNQPLHAVASYCEAAQRLLGAGNPKPERLTHALQEAAGQAQRAGNVVRELMRFLQRGESRTEALDLNALVGESLRIVESSGLDGFATRVHLARGLRPVQANRMQVEKVLINLLRNSVEAMRGFGIATRAITIDVTTAEDHQMALVTVRDEGPGLDAERARRLFEPFFSTKSHGIGMGLAISRALVEANGGRLWYDPDTGPGATFRFTLPFAP